MKTTNIFFKVARQLSSRRGFHVAFALFVCICPAYAGSINFDELSGGLGNYIPVAGDHYRSQGVLFSTNGSYLFAYGDPSIAHSAPNAFYASQSNLGNADRDIIIDFVVPGTSEPSTTNQVSFFVVDAPYTPAGTWSAFAYDLTGKLLLSTSSTAVTAQVLFTRPNPDIHRVVFSPSYECELIDSLSFGAIVPEPTAIVLCGIGACLLLPTASRRRNSQKGSFRVVHLLSEGSTKR